MSPENLVQEIGQRLGISLTLDQAGLARLLIDASLPIDFEFDQAGNRLLVYASLGTVMPGAERESLFAELLAANLFGSALGSCSPALDTVRGEMLLWFALNEEVDIQQAMDMLENLVSTTEHWLGKIASGATQATPGQAHDSSLDNFLLA